MNRRLSTFTVFSRKTGSILAALALAAVAVVGIIPARGQDEAAHFTAFFAVHPLENPDADAIRSASDAGTGLKVFTYNVTSTRAGSKGQKFTGMMVGDSPF